MTSKKLLTIIMSISLVVTISLILSSTSATAASAKDFYDGKVITMLVPNQPGSGSDFFGRLALGYIAQAIPGVSMSIKNMPDASGLVARNSFAKSVKPDGLTIMVDPTGAMWMPAALDEKLAYDITQFNYLGGIRGGELALMVKAKGKYTSIEALKAAKGLKFASRQPGALPTIGSVAAIDILGLDASIITGYASSGTRFLALMQGEVDCMIEGIDVAMNYVKSGMDAIPLCVINEKKDPNFPDVKSLTDIMKLSDSQKLLLTALFEDTRFFCVPPGTPADRVQYLRESFNKILSDKGFIEQANTFAGGQWMGAVSGERLQEQAATVMKNKNSYLKVYKALMDKYVKK